MQVINLKLDCESGGGDKGEEDGGCRKGRRMGKEEGDGEWVGERDRRERGRKKERRQCLPKRRHNRTEGEIP